MTLGLIRRIHLWPSVVFGFQQRNHPDDAGQDPGDAADNGQGIAEVYARGDEDKARDNEPQQADDLVASLVHRELSMIIASRSHARPDRSAEMLRHTTGARSLSPVPFSRNP